MAITLIPENTLIAVIFPMHMCVPIDVLEALFIRQHGLQTLHIGNTNGALARLCAENAVHKDWLINPIDLTIPNACISREQEEDMGTWSRIVVPQRRLRNLEVKLAAWPGSPDENGTWWMWRLGVTLFANARPDTTDLPLRLESLKLRNLDFYNHGGTAVNDLMNTFDFAHLKTLVVTAMENNAVFMNALASVLERDGDIMKLKKLHLSTLDRTDFNALTRVLTACNGLCELTIKALGCAGSSPTIVSITKHGATLRKFAYSVCELLGEGDSDNDAEEGENQEWIVHLRPDNLFQAIVNNLTNLEELSLHVGEVTLCEPTTPETTTFNTRVDLIAQHIPFLRALRLLDWPTSRGDIDQEVRPVANGHHNIDAESALLQHEICIDTRKMARSVFELFDNAAKPANHKPLRVIAIGAAHELFILRMAGRVTSYDLGTVGMLTYVRRNLYNLDGVRSILAEDVRRQDLIYDDRDYGIFEYGA